MQHSTGRQGHGGSYPPPIPGFTGDSNLYIYLLCFIGKKIERHFDTLRLHLRLFRALQRAGGDPECVIHRVCDSL